MRSDPLDKNDCSFVIGGRHREHSANRAANAAVSHLLEYAAKRDGADFMDGDRNQQLDYGNDGKRPAKSRMRRPLMVELQ